MQVSVGRKRRTRYSDDGGAPRLTRGLGWLWPAQDCGKSYKDFRSGIRFSDAYEWLAWRANERGETFRPSQKRIVSAMAAMKRSMYDEYIKGCEIERGGGPSPKDWSSCRRVCRIKSRPCGKACVSKKKSCRKTPAADMCAITDFQQALPIEQASADAWEEQRARGGMLDEGDTSFDFAPTPVVEYDDDFGYQAPSRYGFEGLRSGRGGAAANRGRYKPLPAGASAVDQHRQLMAAREKIIRAIESGEFELCPTGSRRSAPAPMTVQQQQTHGSRTQSEIDAIRRRFEKAGYR